MSSKENSSSISESSGKPKLQNYGEKIANEDKTQLKKV